MCVPIRNTTSRGDDDGDLTSIVLLPGKLIRSFINLVRERYTSGDEESVEESVTSYEQVTMNEKIATHHCLSSPRWYLSLSAFLLF